MRVGSLDLNNTYNIEKYMSWLRWYVDVREVDIIHLHIARRHIIYLHNASGDVIYAQNAYAIMYKIPGIYEVLKTIV